MFKNSDLFAGIDPGKSGALAFVNRAGELVEVFDMPTRKTTTRRDETDAHELARIFREFRPGFTALEQVGVRPGEGAVGAFSFGAGFGMLRGVLSALDIAHALVTPQAWRKHARLPSGADKSASISRACELVPTCAPRLHGPRGGAKDGRAEAVLLALYALAHAPSVHT